MNSEQEKLFNKTSPEPTSGCWIWLGATANCGYGELRMKGVRTRAHRYSYELFKGPIPKGLFVCHSCDVPACVNPDHLWVGTQKDNLADMVRKERSASGSRNGMYGKEFTKEHRQKLRENHRGKDSLATKKKKSETKLGSLNPNAKLSEEDIRVIRKKRFQGIKRKFLAEEYKVNVAVISNITSRKTWIHVD